MKKLELNRGQKYDNGNIDFIFNEEAALQYCSKEEVYNIESGFEGEYLNHIDEMI